MDGDFNSHIVDGKLAIPVKFLFSGYRQLKLNAMSFRYGDGYGSIGDYLNKYFYETLKKENEPLFNRWVDEKIKFGEKTIERAIGKNPTGSNYALLDFICYVIHQKKSLIDVIYLYFNDELNSKYFVEIPPYALDQINNINNAPQSLAEESNDNNREKIEFDNPDEEKEIEAKKENIEHDPEFNTFENEDNSTLDIQQVHAIAENEKEKDEVDENSSFSTRIRIFFVAALTLLLLFAFVKSNLFHRKDAEQSSTIKSQPVSERVKFNDNSINADCPLVTISTARDTTLCRGQHSLKIENDSIITVAIYYHNTSMYTARNVRVKLEMISEQYETEFIATLSMENGDTLVGNASVASDSYLKLIYLQVKTERDQSRFFDTRFDGEAIFSDEGLPLYDILGIADCPHNKDDWRDAYCHQGWIMVDFKVAPRNREGPDK